MGDGGAGGGGHSDLGESGQQTTEHLQASGETVV